MSNFTLPPQMKIRHRFFTFSPNLKIKSGDGERLYRIESSPIGFKRRVNIYSADSTGELLLWLGAVGGLSSDVMVSNAKNEIWGVMKREFEFVTGSARWVVLNGRGERLFETRPAGSTLSFFRKRVKLFGTREEKIIFGNHQIGAFFTRFGYVHERYDVELDRQALPHVDNAMLLATITTLTGIFYRAFT